jgi:hypothetical protein
MKYILVNFLRDAPFIIHQQHSTLNKEWMCNHQGAQGFILPKQYTQLTLETDLADLVTCYLLI